MEIQNKETKYLSGWDPNEVTAVRQRPHNVELEGLRNTKTGELTKFEDRQHLTIGSHRTCDIILRDPFVSRIHARIEISGGVVKIRDQRSRNGTFLNGAPIESAELHPGNMIQMGGIALIAIANAKKGPAPAFAGTSSEFLTLLERAQKIARTDANVLILGETGVGKDVLAHYIHKYSRRANAPFIAVNCGAIPHDLVASELFGHLRGSFTGATNDRGGSFQAAHTGSLFLDEVGEMPLTQQPSLLRAVEQKTIRRVGATDDTKVDVRIIAATNRLSLASDPLLFRSDLFHRIGTFVLEVPALRYRKDDIPELVRFFLDEIAPQTGVREVSEEAMQSLGSYTWPGNIRELKRVVQRAAWLGGPQLQPLDFFPPGSPQRSEQLHEKPLTVATALPTSTLHSSTPPTTASLPTVPLYKEQERKLMAQALATVPSLRAAARLIGMPKTTFLYRAQHYGLIQKRGGRINVANDDASPTEQSSNERIVRAECAG